LSLEMSYDSLEDFVDYSNERAWREYIASYVCPLFESARLLYEYFEELKRDLNGKSLGDLEEYELQMVLGGVRPGASNPYPPESLASAYKNFFGLAVDLQAWMNSDEESRKELKVSVESTKFVALVEVIYKLLNRALRSISFLKCDEVKTTDERIEKMKKNPEEVLDEIMNFYKCMLEFSATYNYYTFFLQSLRQIPWEFAKKAYPKIENIKQLLYDFGLRECSWQPFDKEKYKPYRILCWEEYDLKLQNQSNYRLLYELKSLFSFSYSLNDLERMIPFVNTFGGAITIVNDLIWGILSSGNASLSLNKLFGEYFSPVEDIFQAYVKNAIDNLFMETVSATYTTVSNWYEIRYYPEKGYIAELFIGDSSREMAFLYALVDFIAPLSFLGLSLICEVSEVVSERYESLRLQSRVWLNFK